MSNKKFSIVIPTFNHLEECLKPCIESIIKFTDLSETELIIVANGCTDGTNDYINELIARENFDIYLYWFDEPLGYTKATNIGIEASCGEFVILLNNDTILLDQEKNQWIDMLFKPFSNESTAITGPMKAFCPFAQSDFLIFFCVMIRKKMFDLLGLLDECFNPGFGEDTDFGIKCVNAGYNIVQIPEETRNYQDDANKKMVGNFPIYHAGEKTFNNLEKIESFNTDGDKLIRKNRMILAKRYGKGKAKLNLGCGNRPIQGYINIDICDSAADFMMDAKKLDFEDNFAYEIKAIHLFEHFSPYEIYGILGEWKRVLRPGGSLILEMPNILELCNHFHEQNSGGKYHLLNCIFGTYDPNIAKETPHKYGWCPDILYEHLDRSGFVEIKQAELEFTHHWGYNFRMECKKNQ